MLDFLCYSGLRSEFRVERNLCEKALAYQHGGSVIGQKISQISVKIEPIGARNIVFVGNLSIR